MDHLKWDSEVYDEYIASLRKMNQRLDEEIQKLTAARKKLLRQSVTTEDQALEAIVARLDGTIKRLSLASERVLRLKEALVLNADIFAAAERRIGGMGTDMLYSSVAYAAQGKESVPLFTPYTNAFRMNEVTPEWLAALSQGSAPAFA